LPVDTVREENLPASKAHGQAVAGLEGCKGYAALAAEQAHNVVCRLTVGVRASGLNRAPYLIRV